MKKKSWGLVALSALLALGAQAQHGPKSKEITKSPLEVIFRRNINTPEIKDQQVRMVVVTLAPGEVSGAHRHPIPTIAYVLEGEISSTFEGKREIKRKGEAFWEDPNGLHAETVNLSKTREAKLLVYFIGPKEKPFITIGK